MVIDVCGNFFFVIQCLIFCSSSGLSIVVNYFGLEGLFSGSIVIIVVICELGGNVVIDFENVVEIIGGCSVNDVMVSISLFDEGDCVIIGYLVRYVFIVMVCDICGNILDYELFVEVEDMILFVMSGLVEIVVFCGEVILEISVVDVCIIVVSIMFEDSEFIELSCLDDLCNYEWIWWVIDVCGNISVFV